MNEDLFKGMQVVYNIPNSGLDLLLHEGFIAGREKAQLEDCQRTHRQIVELQCTIHVPFATSIPPKPAIVEKELCNPEHITRAVNQFVYPHSQARQVSVSPLTRFGAGYALSALKDVELLAAEDPILDEKAAHAEQYGMKDDFEKWVMTERDAHFVNLVREHRNRIMHLLVGYAHDLTDDVAKSNTEHDEQISHIVVTVKSLADREEESKK